MSADQQKELRIRFTTSSTADAVAPPTSPLTATSAGAASASGAAEHKQPLHKNSEPHNRSFTLTRQEFLQDLHRLMESKGQPITKMPSLGYQELDLFALYKLVIERGGMDEVTRRQEWKLVYQDLGIPTMSTSASYNTRTNYKKYLYVYELEHCDFEDEARPKGSKPRFAVGQFIRIVSEVYEGQVFYAQVVKCRFRGGRYAYYVHYNGWSSSHDEWMPEEVLGELLPEEAATPDALPNPPPSRSSKSNRIIEEPLLLPGERPLPAVKNHPYHQLPIAGGNVGKKQAKRDTSDTDDGSEDYPVKPTAVQRRVGNLSLRSRSNNSNSNASFPPAAILTPLDRAPMFPDWDFIRQELLQFELDEQMHLFREAELKRKPSIRRYHVHHNPDTAIPRYQLVDASALEHVEAVPVDLEPFTVLFNLRLQAIRDQAATHHHSKRRRVSVEEDARTLMELRQAVDSVEQEMRALEHQHRKNAKLLKRMPAAADKHPVRRVVSGEGPVVAIDIVGGRTRRRSDRERVTNN